ncbi:hypothetical protein R0J87_18610, partial [Halomonas sp. SIMBA_159]
MQNDENNSINHSSTTHVNGSVFSSTQMDENSSVKSEAPHNPQPRKPLRSRAKRAIPKSTKKHFVGELVFHRGESRQRLGFASLYEHNAALCFIYRPDFLDIEEQLASLPFVLPNGKPSEHFFDFRVTFQGGRR